MEIYQACESNFDWQTIKVSSSDGKTTYEVDLPPWDRVEAEAVCNCPSYEYRGWCRHQREALTLVCGWTEGQHPAQSEYQKAHGICPKCGESTMWVNE